MCEGQTPVDAPGGRTDAVAKLPADHQVLSLASFRRHRVVNCSEVIRRLTLVRVVRADREGSYRSSYFRRSLVHLAPGRAAHILALKQRF